MKEASKSSGIGMRLDFTEGGELPPALLRRLDDLSESHREAFNALIARLTSGRERDIDWWVSLPASRNTHSSQLFAKCMQLVLVRELLSETTNVSVLTDDPALAKVLRPVLGDSGVTVTSKGRCRRLKRAIWNIASSLFHAFSAHWAAWRTRALMRPLPRSPLSMIEIYVQRDSFAGGVFRDRYYPSFYESLSEDERARLFYLPIFHRVRDYYALFRNLRLGPQNFLVRQDYLNLRDYFFAFGYWWRARLLKGRAAWFAGFEVGPLVDADLEAGRFNNITVQSLLAYRFWRDIGRRNFTVGTIVDWYEGHDIDHATAAAINWHPDTPRLIAFRPIAPASYLSVTPALHEILCGSVAKEWAMVGAGMRRELAQAYPQITVHAAPGLRYRRLLTLRLLPRNDGRKNVLVVLSIDPGMAATVHRMLAPAAAQSSDVDWHIKRHPAMPREEVAAIFCELGGNVIIADDDFYELLARADLVVGLGTNTLMEAVAAGIPVICMSSGNQPTEIPLPVSMECGWWRMAYDAGEFAALLPEAFAVPHKDRADPLVLEELLGPFDAAALRALLFDQPPNVS